MFFTELVNAVRYSENWAESVEKEKAARQNAEKQFHELDELVARISASFDGSELDKEYLASLLKTVPEFVSAASKQVREKLEIKLKEILEKFSAESNSEKLKAVKSLESYLSVTPLPVLDEEVSLELTDGSYAAYARYSCPEEIEYEFLLNTASSSLLRSQFSLAHFKKGAKMPVRLAKTWIKKQPVPDYEKLADYYLSKALASRNHITAKFMNDETEATIGIVYSRSNNESFITVEYSDAHGKVDVTGEPALNNHLDIAFLKESMGKLLHEVSGLDSDKLKLTKLEYSGIDVLGTMDCYGFMQRVAKVMVQSPEIMAAIRKLDGASAAERLKLLGKQRSVIAESFGLVSHGVKRQ